MGANTQTSNTTDNSLLDRFSRETAAKIDIKGSNSIENPSSLGSQAKQCDMCKISDNHFLLHSPVYFYK